MLDTKNKSTKIADFFLKGLTLLCRNIYKNQRSFNECNMEESGYWLFEFNTLRSSS